MVALEENNLWGYFDRNGKEIIPFIAERSSYINSEEYISSTYTFDNMAFMDVDGILAVNTKDGGCFYDIKGNQLTYPDEFEEVRPMINGFAWVKKDGKWGVINFKHDNQIEELNSEDNVKPTENSQKETGTVKIGDGYLNVRESPSMSGKIIGKLYNGDKVTIEETSEDGKWLKIFKSDIKGYVSSNYVSKNGEKSKITMEDFRKGVKCFISKNWKSNIYYKIPSSFCYEENDCLYGEIRTEDNNSPVAGWCEVNKNTGIGKISMLDGTETTFNIKDYL